MTKKNLTSMLDVVFIMLIFFVVTATFVNEVAVDVTVRSCRYEAPNQGGLAAERTGYARISTCMHCQIPGRPNAYLP